MQAPRRSVAPLAAGIVLLVIGQALAIFGTLWWAGRDDLPAAATFIIILSAITLVGGLILLVMGVVNLAGAVDFLAAREYRREQAAQPPARG